MNEMTSVNSNNVGVTVKAKKLVELQNLLKEIKPQIEELKADLLAMMQEQDVLTLKTGSYTLVRAKKTTSQVVDYQKLKEELEKEGIEVITREVFAPQMDLVFREAVKQGRRFDGLENKTTEYIQLKIKS